jgi:hypothetical protein
MQAIKNEVKNIKAEAKGGIVAVVIMLLLVAMILEGCAGFKVYAGVERVDEIVNTQTTHNESFLCKMGYCGKP